ncbi:MAG: response regulator [Flavobacteriales bacterium]|nr:response regulator [Flavobacteriales bacterium]
MKPATIILGNEKQTLLLVDDSPESLTMMVGLLGEDYVVKVAKSGEAALELAVKEPLPDLILLDVVMPGMDGHQVCKTLKSNSRTKSIPVIFLTSLVGTANEARGFELGASDYISKPFDPTIFMARVRMQLELVSERKKTGRLLANFLPRRVVQELISTGTSKPEQIDELSMVFCDLVDFTGIAGQLAKETLLDELSDIFSAFDIIMEAHVGQRLKTIGDAYIGLVGLNRLVPDHADRAVSAALDTIDHLKARETVRARNGRYASGCIPGRSLPGLWARAVISMIFLGMM